MMVAALLLLRGGFRRGDVASRFSQGCSWWLVKHGVGSCCFRRAMEVLERQWWLPVLQVKVVCVTALLWRWCDGGALQLHERRGWLSWRCWNGGCCFRRVELLAWKRKSASVMARRGGVDGGRWWRERWRHCCSCDGDGTVARWCGGCVDVFAGASWWQVCDGAAA
ncbi:hypothetical protein DEO72_LG10g1882 [Vigna unguiculata]|uniref:Uncharacterized protein n=1 Tax=Vigna unguiculata TaxID=3917 RepID=A0A4D6NCN7_VIGUN|nr:hypothetical protein DEO72_LG10g1882 [Vigna unguiculata]